MHQRSYLDVLEAYYTVHVHGRVRVSEEEIQDALKKGTVSWRLRIWPTKTQAEALAAKSEAEKQDLEKYIRAQLKKQDLPLNEVEYFTSDWLDFLDIRPEILQGIANVPVGRISDPIPFDEGYAIMEVLDIRRSSIKEEELHYGQKRQKMADRLHNIKADEIVHNLMDSLLTPLQVRVKGEVITQLAPTLHQWVMDRLPSGTPLPDYVEKPDTSKQYLVQLKSLLDKPLVTYQGGQKTVRDYIHYMDYFRRELKNRPGRTDFTNALLTEIGRMVKNDLFIEQAKKEKLDQEPVVREDLRRWQEKWTYEAFRAELVKDVKLDSTQAREFFKQHYHELDIAGIDTTQFEKYRIETCSLILHKQHLDLLNRHLADLSKKYRVTIDEDRLRKMELLDQDKGRNISMLVLNRFSGKPVMPTADMNWISF
jgi:hypothetical protein